MRPSVGRFGDRGPSDVPANDHYTAHGANSARAGHGWRLLSRVLSDLLGQFFRAALQFLLVVAEPLEVCQQRSRRAAQLLAHFLVIVGFL